MRKFVLRFALTVACFFALVLACNAGPLGIFGRSSGGCSGGSCGGSAIMMSAGSSWGSAMPAQSSGPKSIEIGSVERSLDFYVNAERQRAGLPVVIVDPKMNQVLQAATNEGAKNAMLVRASLPYSQNIARTVNMTPAEVVRGWMGDPASSERILSPDYKACGYASAVGSDGKTYWALAMSK